MDGAAPSDGEPPLTLADRLRSARARQFVGRNHESALFARAVDDDVPPFGLLWLHGPGGIGKSTLLRRFADHAAARGADVRLVDAAGIEPGPRGFSQAVGQVDHRTQARLVLLVDGAEALRPLGAWLREEFLPSLPASAVLVFAGRTGPDERWRTDLGWAEHVRGIALGALARDEAASYLQRRGVPGEAVPALVDAAAGHPLALALLADTSLQDGPAAQSSAPGDLRGAGALPSAQLVGELLARFVGEVTEAAHRRALHLLGHVRVTTQALLRSVLQDGHRDPQDTFDWLRGLSFVQASRAGLAPHDLARAALDADLRWRDPQGWRALRTAVRETYLSQARDGDARTRRRAVADLLWLSRTSPSLRPYPSWDDAFALWWEVATAADLPEILALAVRHEGAASAALHEQWWAAQPEAFVVIRDRPGQVHGFFVQPRLDDSAPTVPRDPFVAAALAHVAATAPLRAGEHLRLLRSWMGVDGYHVPSPTHQALTGATTAAWLSEPGLAVSLSYMHDGEDDPWAPMFAHVDYQRAEQADVTLDSEAGARRYRAYVHDWRVRPPLEWLALLTERADTGDRTPEPRSPAPAGARVLTREQFETCVRAALKNATDARALAASPLLGCRFLRGTAEDPGAADLRSALADAVDRLRTRPRGEREARVLEVTFLARAATQEAAASRLSMPFSTYRRALAGGFAAVVEDLWERELHGR